ncbi:hypothetical protein PISMIDRAFT_70273, partial [Pisolithus microcarpus 441]
DTDTESERDKITETSDAELERLKQEWSSPIYAFFVQEPTIEYVTGQCSHVFWCMAKGCKKGVRWFLDKSDAQSTGNMRKHVRVCWGEDIFHQITQTKNATAVKNYVKNGSIKVTLDCKGKVGYSHRQHTKIETRIEMVRWVAESGQPFEIVGDPGFQTLMKTGHLEYHIPSPDTVA